RYGTRQMKPKKTISRWSTAGLKTSKWDRPRIELSKKRTQTEESMMKFWARRALVLFALLTPFCLNSSMLGQDVDQTTPVRSVTRLPVTCKAGTVIQGADMIVVSGALYLCTAADTWTIVGPATTLDTIWANNFRMKGPVPWTDVTAFGVKPMNHGSVASTTASCNNTTSISLGSAAFNDGDGLIIYGCGPKNNLSTPVGPTVIPSLAEAGTVPVSDRFV